MSQLFDIQYEKICALFDNELEKNKYIKLNEQTLCEEFILLNHKCNNSEDYINHIVKIISQSTDINKSRNISYLVKYCIFLRDIRGEYGRGKRLLFYTFFLKLYNLLPKIMTKVLYRIPDFGSWLDYNKLYEIISEDLLTTTNLKIQGSYNTLKKEIINIWVNQFNNDMKHINDNNFHKTTYCMKWIPKENKSLDKKYNITKHIVKKLFKKLWYNSRPKALKKFRRYIQKYNKNKLESYNQQCVNNPSIQSIIKDIIKYGNSQVLKRLCPMKYKNYENILTRNINKKLLTGKLDMVFSIDTSSYINEDIVAKNTYILLLGSQLSKGKFYNKVLVSSTNPEWIELIYPETLYEFVNSDTFCDIFYSYDMRKVGKELDYMEKIDLLLHLPKNNKLNLDKVLYELNKFSLKNSIKLPKVISCITTENYTNICNDKINNYDIMLWNINSGDIQKNTLSYNNYNITNISGYDSNFRDIINKSGNELEWTLIKNKLESENYIFIDSIINNHQDEVFLVVLEYADQEPTNDNISKETNKQFIYTNNLSDIFYKSYTNNEWNCNYDWKEETKWNKNYNNTSDSYNWYNNWYNTLNNSYDTTKDTDIYNTSNSCLYTNDDNSSLNSTSAVLNNPPIIADYDNTHKINFGNIEINDTLLHKETNWDCDCDWNFEWDNNMDYDADTNDGWNCRWDNDMDYGIGTTDNWNCVYDTTYNEEIDNGNWNDMADGEINNWGSGLNYSIEEENSDDNWNSDWYNCLNNSYTVKTNDEIHYSSNKENIDWVNIKTGSLKNFTNNLTQETDLLSMFNYSLLKNNL